MIHISKNEFETLNWLPVNDRLNQSINSILFKYFTKQCPSYLNKVLSKQFKNKKQLSEIDLSILKNQHGGKMYSLLLVPQYGVKPQRFSKRINSIDTFKHNLKKCYLTQLRQAENNYDLIIITIITITLLFICLLLS